MMRLWIAEIRKGSPQKCEQNSFTPVLSEKVDLPHGTRNP